MNRNPVCNIQIYTGLSNGYALGATIATAFWRSYSDNARGTSNAVRLNTTGLAICANAGCSNSTGKVRSTFSGITLDGVSKTPVLGASDSATITISGNSATIIVDSTLPE
ncbi:YrpD family protein [Paenibacillus sp. DS2015]|uniref:YrpD family protein n=1 Tax=Paenibacillus sp. DS2015 TaxID=3373917 RepID=UPI003D260D1E